MDHYEGEEFVNICGDLSETIGLGWVTAMPNEASRILDSKGVIKQNIIVGFKVYEKSAMFMKELPGLPIISYFDYDSTRLLSNSELSGLKNFLDDYGSGYLKYII